MAIEVFLGNPPANIRTWIEQHAQPAGHSDTRVTYSMPSGLPDWSGEIVGELNMSSIPDIEEVVTVDIGNTVTSIGDGTFSWNDRLNDITVGNNVTSIGNQVFQSCFSLASIIIPNNVTSIGINVFIQCNILANVTFEGKDKTTVQGMTNYPFGLDQANENGVTIHCTDGDIQIQYSES